MKQYILLLVLMVMGAGMTVHAEDVNPVKVGNVISGLSRNLVGIRI